MLGRIAIFIDGAYFEKVLISFGNPKIDFSKFANFLSEGREILRTYYYNCLPYKSPQPSQEESERFAKRRKFYSKLESLPRFCVRIGRLEYRGKEATTRKLIFEQKRIDVMFGVDMVNLCTTKQISTLAIVTGDSDFIPAIEIAKSHGVLTILWAGTGSEKPHNELWQLCDERREITKDLLEKCLL